ncbi:MAG: SDR family NAD(P)-dependent oxidoreductase, partial [Myxococcota bacterium]
MIARCDAVSRRAMGISVAHELRAGPTAERVADPLVHGLLAVVVGLGLDAAWRAVGVRPDAVVGHSIGEFAAAAAAGALTPEDATRLTCAFLRFARRLVDADTAMAAVRLGVDDARAALAGEPELDVCVDNAPDQVVIGGDAAALRRVAAALAARGVDVRWLPVPIAPHAPLARRLAPDLAADLVDADVRPLHTAWISSVTASPLDTVDRGYWVRNLGEPNRFREALLALAARGCDAFLQVGAHPVLTGAVRATLPGAAALATVVRGERVAEAALHTASALGASWALPAAPPAPQAVVLPLSAATPASLEALKGAWRERLGGWDPARAALAAAAAGAGRAHHRHRVAVVGRSPVALAEGLAAAGVAAPEAPGPVAFVFSGQGAAFEGVGRALYAEEAAFRDAVDACDAVVRSLAGWSLVDALLFDDPAGRSRRTGVVQPLLFAVQVGLARLWARYGVVPGAVVGQSVGEVAAACVAGALSLPEAVRVVLHRGQLMEDAATGGRTAEVALPAAQVEAVLAGRPGVCVAGINGPATTLVAGDAEAVEALVAELATSGADARLLRMAYAFHSHHMDALLPRLAEALGDVAARAPEVPLWSSVTGEPVEGAALDAAYWCANVRQAVRLAPAVDRIVAAGHTALLEVSPHPVLREPLSACLRARTPHGAVLHSLRRGRDDREELLGTVAALYRRGHALDWAAVQGRGDPTLPPRYPWDRRRFWIERTAAPSASAPLGPSLLGHRLDPGAQPGTVYWEATLAAESPAWLGDHRVRGRAIAPGAAFAEMALAAGRALRPELLEVRELRFLAPLPLDRPRLVQVCAVRHGDGATVQIHARPAGDAEAEPVLHATARIASASAASEASAPPPVAVGADELYARLARSGLDYGPLFRGVVGLHAGDGEARGQVALPEALDGEPVGLHPALLDACFHVATAALPDDGRTWVPVGIDRVRVVLPGATALRVHAEVHVDGARRRATLRGWAGDALALEVDGLEVATAEAEEALPPVAAWLYEEAWPEAPWPAPDPAPAGAWTVLGDPLPLSQRGPVRGVVYALLSERPVADAVLEVVETARAAAAADVPLVVVTRGARGLDGHPSRSLAGAAAWGVARALAVEDPARYGGAVDLDPEQPVLAQLDRLAGELAGGLPDDQVAFRGGVRRVGRLLPAPDALGEPLQCRADGTYLVTGGLGGLGLLAAERLADRGARRLVLLGRTPMPARSAWDAEDPRVRAIRALEARGVTVRTAAVDVGDGEAVLALIARLADELPPIRGVVHAAGVLRDQTLDRVDDDSVACVLRPKVDGALALDAALGDALDFFVLYSSAAGTLGSAGQAAYAAANLVVDEIARAR